MDGRSLAGHAATAAGQRQHGAGADSSVPNQLPRVLQHTLDSVAAITAAPPDAEPGDAALERLRSSVYALKHSARSAQLPADIIDRVWCAVAARAASAQAAAADHRQAGQLADHPPLPSPPPRAPGPAPPSCGTTRWTTTT
jgi:hypothetical protein